MVAAAGYYPGKTSDEEKYTVHEKVEKGSCSLCWRFLSCPLMTLMVWYAGRRELLTWGNFRRGGNTMYEQKQGRQKKTCPKIA
ncbi:hypothetical protein CDAR_21691 [Caerostris darwini]|uniref:Uncharacterized protein n=1 Tax=Caerostris darwini TaxID=1538125 RepID=A0AAV4VF42_9ARAC|nr:hypothetical protein CDAR_21691 [Caerostris darwini]